jgi:N-ethylmaleimide reductase
MRADEKKIYTYIKQIKTMESNKLFSPVKVGAIELKNRMAMSPMTRSRAIGHVPNDLMAEYYAQRADAGLIITEGTSPSPNGQGYARTPGIYTAEQVEGWKKVTSAVHAKGGKIFMQIMHTGRISHLANMPAGAEVLAPSAVGAAGQMWTDTLQMQDFPIPKEMTASDIKHAQAEFVTGAKNAIAAGMDGIELHGANGYLLEQFLSPHANVREDNYGGSVENRARFVIEVVAAVAEAIGKEKTAIRLSPYGVASDMAHYPEIEETYTYVAGQLNQIGIAYIHIADHSAMGAPHVPVEIKEVIRKKFKNTIILGGGFDKETAEAAIESGLADVVAFGRQFINNPDLAERFAGNLPLNPELRMDLFYSAGAEGYVDYPAYSA